MSQSWRGDMCTGILSSKRGKSKLTLCPERISIDGPLGHLSVSRDDLTRIERAGFFPWFWMGIRIHHNADDCPPRLQFTPYIGRTKQVLKAAANLGYPVATR